MRPSGPSYLVAGGGGGLLGNLIVIGEVIGPCEIPTTDTRLHLPLTVGLLLITLWNLQSSFFFLVRCLSVPGDEPSKKQLGPRLMLERRGPQDDAREAVGIMLRQTRERSHALSGNRVVYYQRTARRRTGALKREN